MRHEPSGSVPLVQPIADRRCRRSSAVVAFFHRRLILREVRPWADASHLALLAQPRGGGGDAV